MYKKLFILLPIIVAILANLGLGVDYLIHQEYALAVFSFCGVAVLGVVFLVVLRQLRIFEETSARLERLRADSQTLADILKAVQQGENFPGYQKIRGAKFINEEGEQKWRKVKSYVSPQADAAFRQENAHWQEVFEQCIRKYPDEPAMAVAMWEKAMLAEGFEFGEPVEEDGQMHFVLQRGETILTYLYWNPNDLT